MGAMADAHVGSTEARLMAITNVHLKLDDGWAIMEMRSTNGKSAIYWVVHEHPNREYNFKYTDLKRCIKTRKMRCFHCGAVAPTAALGFCNMLEGEMLYDGGGE